MHVNRAKGEPGYVLIATMIVLVMLTVIGLAAVDSGTVEIQIAANEKYHSTAFYNADTGVYVTPKVVSKCVDNSAAPDLNNATARYYETGAASNATAFLREVMGFDASDGEKDVIFQCGDHNAEADVTRTGAKNLAGGGVEFASGAEGVGAGSTGGVGLYYRIEARGRGPRSSASEIVSTYRKVTGMPGGL